ncbi:amidohydrolase [Thioclava kandeliae]|uniref:Amidohydrolase n=1 Tax=Thioclava kandeliae TaxID=3070818 RepID=A0ABV1SLN6_9RHOB
MQAELLLLNADIVTMDPGAPRAQALAIADGRIVAVGTQADLLELDNGCTRRIDARGLTVLPGLRDNHIHLQDSGYYNGTMADLTRVRTALELIATLREFAATQCMLWVGGQGYSIGIFNEDTLSREDLDLAVPDRPCLIYAADLHSACLNTRGCEALGLTSDTPDPVNGRFSRDARGVPTGMLHEEAITWAQDRMPPVTEETYMAGVRFGQELCHRHGLTGALDPKITLRHAAVYQRMVEDGSLTLRMNGAAWVDPEETDDQTLARLMKMRRDHWSDMFRIHSAKFFIDGVLENRTAAMIEGYQDARGGNAPLLFTPEKIARLFPALDAARFQIHCHVIGDLAVRAVLDGLETARATNGDWPALHQVTHLQCVRPEDIARLGKLRAMANLQALWARAVASVTEVCLPMAGPALAETIYPFRSIIEAGAPFCLTSDWGVSTLNPFEIMSTALTRQVPGQPAMPVFLPHERLSRAQVLTGYTTGAAAGAWRPDTGSLRVGAQADFIVVDRDVTRCDPHELGATQVELTVVGGREVYRRLGFDG